MRRLFVLAVMSTMIVVGGVAHAAWLATGSGFAVAQSGTFPSVEPPTPVSLTIADGADSPGRPTEGDTITVTFSDEMDVSTFCEDWSGNGEDQATTGTVRLERLTGPGGNRTEATLSEGCDGSGFNFGMITLDSHQYVSTAGPGANVANFSDSPITWTPSTRQLTIELGTHSGKAAETVAEATATYTPDGTLKNSSGVDVEGTVSASGQHF